MPNTHYRPIQRRTLQGTLIAALLGPALISPSQLYAQSGVQVTPDGKRVVISKDVGDQRWAIVRDLTDQSVTGNVFFPGGGEPAFVFCEKTGDDGNPDPGSAQVSLRCSTAPNCRQGPCQPRDWVFLADVTVPASFLDAPTASDGESVPTDPDQLFAYLQAGRYREFAAESGAHPSSGPHGGAVRTFLNGALLRSMQAGSSSHPIGAASVKELFRSDGTTLLGWAVEVKTQAESDAGRGWYWYEVFSTTNGTNPIEGQGNPSCTGCHSQGRDFVRVPFPLQ